MLQGEGSSVTVTRLQESSQIAGTFNISYGNATETVRLQDDEDDIERAILLLHDEISTVGVRRTEYGLSGGFQWDISLLGLSNASHDIRISAFASDGAAVTVSCEQLHQANTVNEIQRLTILPQISDTNGIWKYRSRRRHKVWCAH